MRKEYGKLHLLPFLVVSMVSGLFRHSTVFVHHKNGKFFPAGHNDNSYMGIF